MAERRPNRALGPGHDKFWAWCAKGELRLPRCTNCGEINWPVVPACEICGGADLPFERMSGRGEIASFCTFERDYTQGLLPIPWETILVRLEEGPLFVSNPVDLGWHDLRIGMPVDVTFLPAEDAAGAFMLPVFRAGGMPPASLGTAQDDKAG